MSHPAPHPGSEALPCFDHQPRTRVVFGADSIDRAGELARELGAKKVLLVTDPGIVAAGHADHLFENLEAAVALHFMWYNFGRVHQTLRVTPAMEAGMADHVWSIEEIVGLLGVSK